MEAQRQEDRAKQPVALSKARRQNEPEEVPEQEFELGAGMDQSQDGMIDDSPAQDPLPVVVSRVIVDDEPQGQQRWRLCARNLRK
jgi:hypothetical protein